LSIASAALGAPRGQDGVIGDLAESGRGAVSAGREEVEGDRLASHKVTRLPSRLRSRRRALIIKGMHTLLVIDVFGLLAALVVAFLISRRIGAWRRPR
jgi:hypothetical protein